MSNVQRMLHCHYQCLQRNHGRLFSGWRNQLNVCLTLAVSSQVGLFCLRSFTNQTERKIWLPLSFSFTSGWILLLNLSSLLCEMHIIICMIAETYKGHYAMIGILRLRMVTLVEDMMTEQKLERGWGCRHAKIVIKI